MFSQIAVAHLRKRTGCPQCSKHISKGERAYLDSVGLPDGDIYRQVYLPIEGMRTGYRVDGFDPVTNTIYEYHGDYWHGNPALYSPEAVNLKTGKTFGHHYASTLEKQRLLEEAGYRVIVMWESDWKKMQRSST
jgi:hypothetical protein